MAAASTVSRPRACPERLHCPVHSDGLDSCNKMGIYDRDYYRDTDTPRMGPASWSVTTWLIVLCLAAFFIDALAAGQQRRPRTIEEYMEREQRRQELGPLAGMSPLKRWGHFSMATAIEG